MIRVVCRGSSDCCSLSSTRWGSDSLLHRCYILGRSSRLAEFRIHIVCPIWGVDIKIRDSIAGKSHPIRSHVRCGTVVVEMSITDHQLLALMWEPVRVVLRPTDGFHPLLPHFHVFRQTAITITRRGQLILTIQNRNFK
jgi:hypothetical protein